MSAKDILIKPIDSKSARSVCKKYHYSGKVVPNSQIHLGVYYNGKCEGVMQFGPSMDKRRMAKSLGVGFNEFLELNRMALSDNLPRFSESRAISIAIRIIKKNYPFIRVIVSFADACQCGDGTIYRASGFNLIDIKINNSLFYLSPHIAESIKEYINIKSGVVADKTLNNLFDKKGKRLSSVVKSMGAKPISGYQMKYLYCIDRSLLSKYDWIPFNKIPKDAKMYKGEKAW